MKELYSYSNKSGIDLSNDSSVQGMLGEKGKAADDKTKAASGEKAKPATKETKKK